MQVLELKRQEHSGPTGLILTPSIPILNQPKQVVRSPLQDLDDNDGETLRQPASRRVSFTRTSQIKYLDLTATSQHSSIAAFQAKKKALIFPVDVKSQRLRSLLKILGLGQASVREYEPAIDTKGNQDDDSLESIEDAENQPESSSVFDGHSSVKTQKKSKRKRTPTIQPSLNASNIEASGGLCSDLNQSLQQSPCARVVKQPRKSLDCSKADILEEGDTELFLDELNLTDTMKCSYSCIDMSTNLTRTLMNSVLDSSDADSCGSKIDLPEAYSSNNSSKSFGNDVSKTLIADDEDSMDDALPNKGSNVLDTESSTNRDMANMCESLKIPDGDVFIESTLHAEEIEAVNGSNNVEQSVVTQHESSEEVISNIKLSIDKNDTERENSNEILATVTSDNDTLLHIPNKDAYLDESKTGSCDSGGFETSMDLTIPQLRNQDPLTESDHKEENVLLTQCLHDNDLDTVDLDMTVAFGQIVKKRPSGSDNLRDKMKSLGDSLDADEMCMKAKLADTVSPDLEISMTNTGITIKENMESQGSNLTDESGFIYEDDADIGGMDLTVPLGKLKMFRARDKLEKTDAFKPLEASELLYSPNSTFVGKREDESLLKEMTERSSFEGNVNSFSGSEGFDETFADMHGMDMTVPLGKISEKMPKPLSENTMQHSGDASNPAVEEQLKNDILLEEILEEDNEKAAESNVECQTPGNELKLCNDKVTSYGESQEMNRTDVEAGMISVTATLHEENCENISDNMELFPQMSDEVNSEAGGMDATCTPVISKEEFDNSINSSRTHNTKFDVANTDIMGVDSNVPLENQESELLEASNETESVFPMGDASRPESVSPGKTLLLRTNQSDHFEDSVQNAIAEGLAANHANSDIVGGLNAEICEDNLEPPTEFQLNDTNSDEMGMEITVSLESSKRGKHETSVENFFSDNHIMDETNSDTMGMELTIPLGRLKGIKPKDPVDDALAQSQALNASNHDMADIEMSHLEGRSNEVEGCQNIENSPVNRTVAESQIPSDLTLEAVGEDPLVEGNTNLMCSLLVEPQKVDNPNPDVVAEEISVTQGEMQGGECESDAINYETLEMESAVPAIELKEDNVINPEDISTESKQGADSTLMTEEMSVIQSGLQWGECKNDETNSKADEIAETQKADDSNAAVMSVELCVPQMELKAIDDEDHMIKGVGNTLFAPVETESTAPIAELEEGNISHANGITIESQQIDGTIPDEVDMDFTVPMGISKVIKDEHSNIKDDMMDNTAADSQLTNLEAMGGESSILLVEKDAGFTLNVTAEPQELDYVNPDAMNVEILEEELQEVTQENNETPSITECQILDDTNSETLAMDSTAELKLNNIHHEEKIVAESEQIGEVYPAEIGMELFIPPGGLKGNKHDDCGNAGELGLQLVDEMSPDAGEIKKVVPLVILEDKKVFESSNDIGEEPQAENENSIKKLELDNSGVECIDTVPQADNECQAVESTDLMGRQLFNSSEGQDCGSPFDDNVTKPISNDGINGIEVGMEMSGPDEQEEIDPIPDRLQDYHPDTSSRDIQSEQKISYDVCDDKMVPEKEEMAVECQGSEEIISEGAKMEQSISEAMDDELQAVDSKNAELDAITETSINEEELMVVTNTPIKNPETTIVSESPSPIMVKLEIDIGHTDTLANEVSAEYDGSPLLIIQRNEQLLEMSAREGNALNCDDAGAFPKERQPTEECDVSFDVRDQTKLNNSCAEIESPVSIGKSKSHDEVNELAVSLPSQFNASVEVNCDVDSSNADITNRFTFVDDNSIIKNDSSIITLEIVPDIYSVSMSGLGADHSHVDLSLSQVNTSEIHSEELAMEGISFCERDFLTVDNDCLENMDDTSIQETLDPDRNGSSCELKSFHHYELDCTSKDESDESQLDQKFSNLEEMRPETSSIGANASDSSAANIAVDAFIQEESYMPHFSKEDWIKLQSSKQSCNWETYKLAENQYSFVVFHESALLTVNLQPLLEGQNYKNNRIVESVVLESCFTDDHNRCLKLVMNVMLKRLSSSLLSSKCSSTDQLPCLFDFLGAEFSALNILLRQLYELMRGSPVTLKSDGLAFMVPSVQRLSLFEVQINLLNWDKDGVKPDDIQVKNIIGNVGVVDIQSIFQSVKCDDQYLRNIYNEVWKFRLVEEKVLG
ncbi:putative leucine-rich repeat-containing protein DDB_G0290503 [Hetaerina americana]|uniref:putative leucine-rich repeat-containing protein DDB_G0290503 n=1 Tax=Hetaerina americana TaxID=62018 RepID=UPI003A7F5535